MIEIDFLARQPHYIDHLAPVWRQLPAPRRGWFFTTPELLEYAHKKLRGGHVEIFSRFLSEDRRGYPVMVCAYGDMKRAARAGRRVIHMEHGTGHTFGTPAYPDGQGPRDQIDLFFMPNEFTAKKSIAVRPGKKHIVIGTPKMDEWAAPVFHVDRPARPVIAISFHWGNRKSKPPESGSAWEHYKDILPDLRSRYSVIGHGHPLSANYYRQEFERVGIEYVSDFAEVMKRASVYINDLSSTLYEFLVSGKPVIVLNAPWFRRDVDFGIRFWQWSNVGINVENPGDLFGAIDKTLKDYRSIHFAERYQAVKDLYPFLGLSSNIAVRSLLEYIERLEHHEKIESIQSA